MGALPLVLDPSTRILMAQLRRNVPTPLLDSMQTARLDADILTDKSTGSTLSRSIGVEVSGCSDSLRLG